MTTEREQILALAGEPTGYYFRDDPSKFAMPGAGYSPTYPADALDVVPLYTADQVLAARKDLDQEVVELKADWKTEAAKANEYFHDAHMLRQQLAAAQAQIQQYREALETCQKKQIIYECSPAQNYKTYDSDKVAAALALPTDTSALEAIVKQAGEVMRERCWQTAQPDDSYQDEWFKAKADSCARIRALPGVKLEDLQG